MRHQVIYGRPNRNADGGLRDIIYSVECDFFRGYLSMLSYKQRHVLCAHKNDGIRPLRTYASQLDYYTPVSMQLDGGDLTKIPTYLSM